MGAKLNMIPLPLLLSYQQVIEMTSMQLAELLDAAEADVKAGLLDRSGFDLFWKSIKEKVEANNEVDMDITNEINKRIISKFGSSISTPKTVLKVIEDLNSKKEKYAKLKKERENAKENLIKKNSKPVKKLNTKVSKEKKV